jgi:hypothetical protein
MEVELPIGYRDEEGHVQRKVVLRKMTGKEEALLADRRNQKNGGRLVTELIQSCLVRLGERATADSAVVTNLYSADRNFLLLKLRTLTFGPELESNYTCSVCGEKTHVTEDLDSLPVRALVNGEMPEEIVVQLEDGFSDRDGQNHRALTMRLPTGKDEEAVAGQMRQNASLGKNALLARCMISLGDLPRHRIEALGPKILSDLTMTDRRLIDRAINQAAPGLNMIREIECAHCGETFKQTLDMSHFFVLE